MSQKQPAHRRPSWAKHEKSFQHYMRTDLARDRSPGDYGVDNFSYDQDHLAKWQIPSHLLDQLPEILRTVTTDWQLAGAAVCTGLDRIKRLDDESIYRGYPDKSHHHLSRRVSNISSPAVSGAAGTDTPPMNSPVILSHGAQSNMPSNLTTLDKISFDGIPTQRQQVMGMESPPFTPVDSQTCSTPEMFPSTSNPTVPDMQALARQLSPISMRSRNDSAASSFNKSYTLSSTAVFDESAWDIYLNNFRAELNDIKSHAWPRFRGLGLLVERHCAEESRQPEWKAGVAEFLTWWFETKPKVAEYQERVKGLEVPSLEYVRMERQAKGMSI